MPKSLFLCRHADTLERVANQTDFERKLSAPGLNEAQNAATWMRQFNLMPDYITCSVAVRTTETTLIIAQTLGVNPLSINQNQELYTATATDLLHKLSQINNLSQVALVVGHNPAVSEIVGILNHHQRFYVPTGGVNFFIFDCEDWQEITWSTFQFRVNY